MQKKYDPRSSLFCCGQDLGGSCEALAVFSMQHLGCRLALLHVGHHRSLGHEKIERWFSGSPYPPENPPKTKMTATGKLHPVFLYRSYIKYHSNGWVFQQSSC